MKEWTRIENVLRKFRGNKDRHVKELVSASLVMCKPDTTLFALRDVVSAFTTHLNRSKETFPTSYSAYLDYEITEGLVSISTSLLKSAHQEEFIAPAFNAVGSYHMATPAPKMQAFMHKNAQQMLYDMADVGPLSKETIVAVGSNVLNMLDFSNLDLNKHKAFVESFVWVKEKADLDLRQDLGADVIKNDAIYRVYENNLTVDSCAEDWYEQRQILDIRQLLHRML